MKNLKLKTGLLLAIMALVAFHGISQTTNAPAGWGQTNHVTTNVLGGWSPGFSLTTNHPSGFGGTNNPYTNPPALWTNSSPVNTNAPQGGSGYTPNQNTNPPTSFFPSDFTGAETTATYQFANTNLSAGVVVMNGNHVWVGTNQLNGGGLVDWSVLIGTPPDLSLFSNSGADAYLTASTVIGYTVGNAEYAAIAYVANNDASLRDLTTLLSVVATDGITITGDGTSGSPLISTAGAPDWARLTGSQSSVNLSGFNNDCTFISSESDPLFTAWQRGGYSGVLTSIHTDETTISGDGVTAPLSVNGSAFNPFDQSLNQVDSPSFAGLTVAGALNFDSGGVTSDSGTIIAAGFQVNGGSSSEFLKADGSRDSTSYLTSIYTDETTISGDGVTTPLAVSSAYNPFDQSLNQADSATFGAVTTTHIQPATLFDNRVGLSLTLQGGSELYGGVGGNILLRGAIDGLDSSGVIISSGASSSYAPPDDVVINGFHIDPSGILGNPNATDLGTSLPIKASDTGATMYLHVDSSGVITATSSP